MTKKQRQVLINCGIFESYHDVEYDKFSVKNEAWKYVGEYIKNLINAKNHGLGVFLYGTQGTGKTYLAIVILKEALRNGFSVRKTSLSQIIMMMTQGWYDDLTRTKFEKEIKNVDFLLIDDIGKEYQAKGDTPLHIVAFDGVIRYRVERQKPTILTSNHPPSELREMLGASITSILSEKVLPVEFSGPDFRKTNIAPNNWNKLRGQNDK